MMNPLALSLLAASVVAAGCTSAPSLQSTSFKVSAPASGAVTVSSVDRVSDSTVQAIRLAVRPSGAAPSSSPLLSTVVSVHDNGSFDPVTMGSSAGPVLSGHVLSAEAWNTGAPFWMTAGPAISLIVP